MSKSPTIVLVLAIGHLLLAPAEAVKRESINLRMPNIIVPKQERYLCVAHRVSGSGDKYIGNPRHEDPNNVWDCGYGQFSDQNPGADVYDGFSVCGYMEQSKLIYILVLPDTPSLLLPPEVGIKVGGDSGLNYLVMQIHYKPHEHSGMSHSHTDSSGAIVHMVSGRNHGITKLADVFPLSSRSPVPVGFSSQSVECGVKQDIIIHPFSYLTHTHDLGIKMGLYKFPGGDRDWPVLIGEANPQEPQVYLPVRDHSVTVERGDVMMSYCDYYNPRNKTVYYGLSHEDEMCIFFLMYWVEGEKLLKKHSSCGYF